MGPPPIPPRLGGTLGQPPRAGAADTQARAALDWRGVSDAPEMAVKGKCDRQAQTSAERRQVDHLLLCWPTPPCRPGGEVGPPACLLDTTLAPPFALPRGGFPGPAPIASPCVPPHWLDTDTGAR